MRLSSPGFFHAVALAASTQLRKVGYPALQLTPINPCVSDHRTALFGEKVLSLNHMMRGRVKRVDGCVQPNNAFFQEETRAEYQKRITRIMTHVVICLRKNPDIQTIAFQEAAIEPDDIAVIADIFEHFLPEWHQATFSVSDFGVMTFIRSNDHPFQFDTKLSERLGALASRCETFENGKRYKLSNVHVPHCKSADAFAKMIDALLDDAIENGVTKHDIVGDFNLSPAELHQILEKVWQKKQSLLKLTVHCDASEQGHLKADGTLSTVDCLLSLRFSEKIKSEKSFSWVKTKLHYLTYLLAGGLALSADSAMVEEAALTVAATF